MEQSEQSERKYNRKKLRNVQRIEKFRLYIHSNDKEITTSMVTDIRRRDTIWI